MSTPIIIPPSFTYDLNGVEPGIGEPKIIILLHRPGIAAAVQNQFPDFVRDDHPRFMSFMTSYYKWMESSGNVLYDSQRISQYQDIDTSPEVYTEQFFKEFLVDIPRTVLADKKLLLKLIRQFYRSKGTEKSYKIFFRLLYNMNVDFYYPRVDILRCSDGKWIQKISLKVVELPNSTSNIINFQHKKIRGLLKNASAFVEEVYKIRQGAFLGYELLLNQTSIAGVFYPEEIIQSEDGSITAKISPVPISANIINPGEGFDVGDSVEIPSKGTVIVVDSVDQNGAIKKLKIQNYGFGYSLSDLLDNFTISKPSGSAHIPAKFSITLGGSIKYPGYYANSDGQLSAEKYIHDGEYYQQFSYVLYTELSAKEYKSNLYKLTHPSGLKMFGGLRTQHLIPAIINSNKHTTVRRGIEHLKSAKSEFQKTKISIKHSIVQSHHHSFPLGSSNYSITQQAFRYKPYYGYNANDELIAPNENYFGLTMSDGVSPDLVNQYANTPISIFDVYGLSPYQIIEHKYQKCVMQPDAVVISRPSSE